MQVEIEAKFLRIDHTQFRETLRSLGAVCDVPERLMRRKNFDYSDSRLEKKGGWVRVRDEGDKVTLAYKQLNHRGMDGTQEVSVIVNNFDDTCHLFESIGFKQTSYQETKRESWHLGDVQIELDTWPWIPSFVEIEASNERVLLDVMEQCGFDKSAMLHGSVEVAYMAEYDVTEQEIDSWETIVFSDVPGWLVGKRR